ncbi:acetylglutamate kinase [Alicyclobacillus cellulosilyticus]|uniref:acetylglutamate kinase n=1 Tax=Alicyclobacillus cellulosilyticus TaxID=1003997 RepID=A0A917K8R3_9BACL|nr:acetylglutamate kinase [Alicyclobacillus cellulosilyticus]GGJ03200.1 acetylglutamate kinase [Alicyclobacillus cellulosilyticus]
MAVTVLKIGGALRDDALQAVVRAVHAARRAGDDVAVVHGGGPRITAALAEAGIELPFVDGLRLTTPEAVTVVERVLAREVNGELVAQLCAAGLPACGLSGADGILWARGLPGMQRTGEVARVEVQPVRAAWSAGHVPVLAPVGVDEHGRRYNVNADLAAAAVAGRLGARRVVFLTDVPGIYEDFAAKRLLTDVRAERLRALRSAGCFTAGMIPKVEAVLAAIDAGVKQVYVVDGRDEAAVTWAATDAGEAEPRPGAFPGTRVTKEEVA